MSWLWWAVVVSQVGVIIADHWYASRGRDRYEAAIRAYKRAVELTKKRKAWLAEAAKSIGDEIGHKIIEAGICPECMDKIRGTLEMLEEEAES